MQNEYSLNWNLFQSPLPPQVMGKTNAGEKESYHSAVFSFHFEQVGRSHRLH